MSELKERRREPMFLLSWQTEIRRLYVHTSVSWSVFTLMFKDHGGVRASVQTGDVNKPRKWSQMKVCCCPPSLITCSNMSCDSQPFCLSPAPIFHRTIILYTNWSCRHRLGDYSVLDFNPGWDCSSFESQQVEQRRSLQHRGEWGGVFSGIGVWWWFEWKNESFHLCFHPQGTVAKWRRW